MPVVKNLDLTALGLTSAPDDEGHASDLPEGLPMRPMAALTPKEESQTDLAENFGLYIGVLMIAALALRLLFATLGPADQIDRALAPQTQAERALAQTLVDQRSFGLQVADPRTALPVASVEAAPTIDVRIADTPAQWASAIESLREARGESSRLFVGGVKVESGILPGYPAVLALMDMARIDGPWLILVQAVVSGLCVWLAYTVGVAVMGRKTPALAVAAVVAFHPALIAMSLRFTGDAWAGMFALLGLSILLPTWVASPSRGVLGGLFLGLAGLFHPVWVWLALPAALWRITRKPRQGATWAMCAVFLAATCVPVGLWMWRNHQVGAGWTLSSHVTAERLLGKATSALASSDAEGLRNNPPAARAALFTQLQEQLAAPANAGVDTWQLANQLGWSTLLKDPVATAMSLRTKIIDLHLGHQAGDAFAALGIAYTPGGMMARALGDTNASTTDNTASAWATNVWVGLNLLLCSGAMVASAYAVVRRRGSAVVMAFAALALWWFAAPTHLSPIDQLPILILQGLLIGTLWLPKPMRMARKKKHRVGDFSGETPEAGFTIGPRSHPVPATAMATTGPRLYASSMNGQADADDDDTPPVRPI